MNVWPYPTTYGGRTRSVALQGQCRRLPNESQLADRRRRAVDELSGGDPGLGCGSSATIVISVCLTRPHFAEKRMPRTSRQSRPEDFDASIKAEDDARWSAEMVALVGGCRTRTCCRNFADCGRTSRACATRSPWFSHARRPKTIARGWSRLCLARAESYRRRLQSHLVTGKTRQARRNRRRSANAARILRAGQAR